MPASWCWPCCFWLLGRKPRRSVYPPPPFAPLAAAAAKASARTSASADFTGNVIARTVSDSNTVRFNPSWSVYSTGAAAVKEPGMLGIPQLTESVNANTLAVRANSQSTMAERSTLLDVKNSLDKSNVLMQQLIDLLKQEPPPSRPGPFSFKTIGQVAQGENVMLKFDVVNIPATDTTDPNNKDVQNRVLTVAVAGGASQTATLPGTDAVAAVSADDAGNPFQGNAGDNVSASLVQVDGSGNVSASRDESVTLTDTIAPDAPGDFGIQVTGQV